MELNITRRHTRIYLLDMIRENLALKELPTGRFLLSFKNQLHPGAAPTQKRALEDNE